jgi:uncharacterized protein YcbX
MESPNGQIINGKRTNKVQQPALKELMDILPKAQGTIGPIDVLDWGKMLTQALGEPVVLRSHESTGLPDDSERPGPTIVAAATLQALGDALGLSLDQMVGRFRPNILLEGLAPFDDDLLVGDTLRTGGSTFYMAKPCNRCVVPTRDPGTGEVYAGFKDRFIAARTAGAPLLAAHLFDHHYKLCVNTIPGQVSPGTVLAQGDTVIRTLGKGLLG